MQINAQHDLVLDPLDFTLPRDTPLQTVTSDTNQLAPL